MKLGVSETKELLQKLASSATWWSCFVDNKDAEELDQVITKLSPLDLAPLGQQVGAMRHFEEYPSLEYWNGLRSSDAEHLAKSRFAASLVGLTSFHFSGYVRQASVEALALQRTGKELPFLLIRLNDWVSQVREVASSAITDRLRPSYASHFLTNVALVIRFKNSSRVEQTYLEAIKVLLKRPDCRDVLQSGMVAKDKTIRRISFQLAAESDPSSRIAILCAVMSDRDAVIRHWVVSQLLPEVIPDITSDIVEPMLRDQFLSVRRAALLAIATKRPDLSAIPLCRALLDKHVSMRETARHFLSATGIEDARAFYIEAIRNGVDAERFAAICGLGEKGKASDSSLILPFLESPLPKLRRAATYALGKLDATGHLKIIIKVLSDPKESVSKEAAKALLPIVRKIPLEDLEKISNSSRFHVRHNALILIMHFDKWRKLPALLNSYGDDDLRIAKFASEALRNWFANYNRIFSEPTQSDLEKIISILSKVEIKLLPKLMVELRGCLKSYLK